jgi:hypothetical protein
MAGGGAKVEGVWREAAGLKAQLSDCPKVKKEMTNLEHELAKLKEEMRSTRPKTEPPAPPPVDGAVPAPSSANSVPKPAPVKVSPPPRRNRQSSSPIAEERDDKEHFAMAE